MKSRVAAGVLAVVVAVGLVGCSGAAPKPSPTPTPPFASADAAYKAAEATYRGYVDALNKVDPDNPKTFEPVYMWLSGPALDADRKELTAMGAHHLRIVGDASVKRTAPVEGGDPLWGDVTIDACYDVHAVDIIDRTGHSLVSPSRADIERLTVTVSRDAGTRTGMRIVQIKIQDDPAQCAASR